MYDIKVLLIEDHEMTRLGISLVCENTHGINLIAQADNGKKGIELALELHPDVILMDIGLPEIDGIQASEIIKNKIPDIKILMFTSRESEKDVLDAFSAGADGYIMKGADKNQLISAIKAVAEGTAWIDSSIARLVLSSINKSSAQNIQSNKNSKNSYGLTEKELEVLTLLVEGSSNAQIAQRLVVTLSTAKAHVHSILQKMYVKNRTQASRQAVKEGLV